MARKSVETLVAAGQMNYLLTDAYDSTKWNLGKGILYNNGASAVDKYISPQIQVIRPNEESTSFLVNYIQTIDFSDNDMYIMGVENTTTSRTTTRLHLWEYKKKTNVSTWKGFITLTYPGAAATYTVRDFKIDRKLEAGVGTVAVSGTAVTGTGTQFATNKVAAGARIGFGSTDPTQITEWYKIATRTSDTALTLDISAGTIAAGTAYVIEEWRPVLLITSGANTAGICYAKGISREDFLSTGTTIAAATTVDDAKAVYWIRDASGTPMIAGAGLDFSSVGVTATNLTTYVLDAVAAATYKVVKYNIRAALGAITAGVSTAPTILTTGNQAVTGTFSQNSNLVCATVNHGAGAGTENLYFVTTSRMYRARTSNITAGNTTWQNDNITEIPCGGTATFNAQNGLSSIFYNPTADTFIITASYYTYCTKYVTSGSQFDRQFLRNIQFYDQSAKDSGHPTLLHNAGVTQNICWAGSQNMAVLVKQSITTGVSQVYVVPLGCDWEYADLNQGYLISPAISTPNAQKYYRAFANRVGFVGSLKLGKQPLPFMVYARTANITTDMTTGWVLIDEANDLSGFSGAEQIQFKFLFQVMGDYVLPARILGINLSYEDDAADSHFQASASKSSAASKQFVWRFATAFGSTVPTLRVRLYDATTSGLLVDDDSAAPTGTLEKSTDGGLNWAAYDTTDKANETTYIRYTPASLADSITVRALLTQA